MIGKCAPWTNKCRLMLVWWEYVDLIVPRKTIYKQKKIASNIVINNFFNKQGWLVIFGTSMTNISIVDIMISMMFSSIEIVPVERVKRWTKILGMVNPIHWGIEIWMCWTRWIGGFIFKLNQIEWHMVIKCINIVNFLYYPRIRWKAQEEIILIKATRLGIVIGNFVTSGQ